MRATAALGTLVVPVLLALCSSATAQTPAGASQPHLDTLTVEAARHRELVERQVKSFVSHLAFKPYDSTLARWQTVAPICPLVAGLSREDGEFILARVSKIAAAAGAPLARGPSTMISAEVRSRVSLNNSRVASARRFKRPSPLASPSPPCPAPLPSGVPSALYNSALYQARIGLFARRNFWILVPPCSGSSPNIHTSRLFHALSNASGSALTTMYKLGLQCSGAKGVNFAQLAAYIALIGLAEIRWDAEAVDAPTILHLFSSPETDRPAGLSTWDQAFLKALYHTRHTDKQQLAEIKTAMLQDIAPR